MDKLTNPFQDWKTVVRVHRDKDLTSSIEFEIAEHRCFAALVGAYNEGWRTYHNLDHILNCLARVDQHIDLIDNPDLIRLAIWYHDFVYDINKTNISSCEETSAIMARDHLHDLGITTEIIDEVYELIISTHYSATMFDPYIYQSFAKKENIDIMRDIDLLGFAADFDVMFENGKRVYQEYRHLGVPSKTFVGRRIKFLSTLLSINHPIFRTLEIHDKYERDARMNISRELNLLTEHGVRIYRD